MQGELITPNKQNINKQTSTYTYTHTHRSISMWELGMAALW